jgi:hypothetical protein
VAQVVHQVAAQLVTVEVQVVVQADHLHQPVVEEVQELLVKVVTVAVAAVALLHDWVLVVVALVMWVESVAPILMTMVMVVWVQLGLMVLDMPAVAAVDH